MTLENIAAEVQHCGSLDTLSSRLSGVNAYEWLENFISIVDAASQSRGLFNNYAILPNQNGDFRKLGYVALDRGIDEDLKDIAKFVGIDSRSELLAKSVQLPNNYVSSMEERQLLDRIKTAVKELEKRSQVNTLRSVSPLLFGWLVKRKYLDDLEAWPIISLDEEEDGGQLPQLSRKERLLIPINMWPSRLQPYADLFPSKNIISKIYSDNLDPNEWRILEQSDFVFSSPVYVESQTLNDDGLKKILEVPLSGCLKSG